MIHDRHDGTFESIHWNLKSTSRCKQRDTYSKKHAWDLIWRPEKISVPRTCPRIKKWKQECSMSSQVFTGHSASHQSCNGEPHLPLFDDVLPTLKGLGFQKTHQPQWRWNHRINEEWPCWAFAICTIRWDSYTLEIFPNACRNRVLLCVDVYRWYIYIYTYIIQYM